MRWIIFIGVICLGAFYWHLYDLGNPFERSVEQKSDTVTHKVKLPPLKTKPVEPPQKSEPAAPAPIEVDTDVIATDFSMRLSDISGLAIGQSVTLDDPEGGTNTFTVRKLRESGRYQTARLTSSGMSSTLTWDNNTFTMTMVTPRGTYNVMGNDQQSVYIDIQFLNATRRSHESDIAVPPVN